MTASHTRFGRLRRPEYTGENRCLPCTIVNLGIAAALAAVIAVAGGPSLGPALAAVVLGGSLVVIWLRGYLVPGTPELTKRYLPSWALALFGKASDRHAESAAVPDGFDPEAHLLSTGVLAETADGSDIAFAPWFTDAWRDALDRDGAVAAARADLDLAALSTLTGLDEAALSLDWHGAPGVAFADDSVIGRWESRPAFRADVAADRVLATWCSKSESSSPVVPPVMSSPPAVTAVTRGCSRWTSRNRSRPNATDRSASRPPTVP